MGHKTKEDARAYQREYRKRVASGTIVPIPASIRRENNTITCDNCGCSFYRPKANRLNRGAGQYCSRACMARSFIGRESPKKGVPVNVNCHHCGNIISRPKWFALQHKRSFCNRKCFGDWKSQEWCGEHNPAWSGGKLRYYGPNWTRQSSRARARDRHRCKFCGASECRREFDVHHIRPFRFFGSASYRQANRLSNLITLCPTCHTFLERFCKSGSIQDWKALRRTGNHSPRGRQIVAAAIARSRLLR